MTKNKGYSAKDIEVLEGLQPVRKRPGMYIGNTNQEGLHHLVNEILDNSIDEVVAGYAKNISFSYKKDKSITIKDDARPENDPSTDAIDAYCYVNSMLQL